MSYSRNVYVGNYAIVNVQKGAAPKLHWNLNDVKELGTEEDKITAQGCRVIFPEFLSHDVLYVMLPKYTRIDDVECQDSVVERVDTTGLTTGFINSYADLFRRIFKATEVKFDFGVIVEVM